MVDVNTVPEFFFLYKKENEPVKYLVTKFPKSGIDEYFRSWVEGVYKCTIEEVKDRLDGDVNFHLTVPYEVSVGEKLALEVQGFIKNHSSYIRSTQPAEVDLSGITNPEESLLFQDAWKTLLGSKLGSIENNEAFDKCLVNVSGMLEAKELLYFTLGDRSRYEKAWRVFMGCVIHVFANKISA